METPGGEVAEEYSDPLSSESFPFPLVPDQDGRTAMAKFGRPPGVRFNCCRRRYHAAPARYGQYPVLQASSAMTFYPNPRPVPDSIPRPAYVPRNFFTAPWGDHDVPLQPDQVDERIDLGTEEVEAVRKVARMAAEVLKDVGKVVRPGVTTAQLDRAVHEMIVARRAYPSTLGYSSYPRSCTTSVNNVIAHGIPDDRPLHPEDIVNIDLTLLHSSFHGDTSATFLLPDTDKAGRDLVVATQEALELGTRACGPGKEYRGIGSAIEDFAKLHGFSVNGQFSGHGIGRNFHQHPYIRHHQLGTMLPGDCFTIEPCLVQGSNSKGAMWDDGWTMATETGARSAQFEYQILVTEDGAEVLTRLPDA